MSSNGSLDEGFQNVTSCPLWTALADVFDNEPSWSTEDSEFEDGEDVVKVFW